MLQQQQLRTYSSLCPLVAALYELLLYPPHAALDGEKFKIQTPLSKPPTMEATVTVIAFWLVGLLQKKNCLPLVNAGL
jgi:hypothetical protein